MEEAGGEGTPLLDRLRDFAVAFSSESGRRDTGLAASDADKETTADHFRYFHAAAAATEHIPLFFLYCIFLWVSCLV